MKNLTLLLFIILLGVACTESSTSTQEENQEVEATAIENPADNNEDNAPTTESDIASINPLILESESKPYDITSYFKFYLNDLEKAEKVLATQWNPDHTAGADGNYDDQLDILNLKGGYMKVVTPVQEGFIFTEYVYWKLSNERVLFGMNQVSMEPFSGEVSTDRYEFRVFENSQWKTAEIGFLEQLTEEINSKSSAELLKSEVIKSLFKLPNETTLETTFRYRMVLPQKGKDIEFFLNHSEGAEVISESQTILSFNDGTFESKALTNQ